MTKKTYRDLDLTPLLTKRFAPYPRTLGRYSVSDIWAILSRNWKGERYKSAHEWLHQSPPDLEGMLRMYNGIIQHEQVQGMLAKEKCEVKKVLPYKNLSIVAKADYLPDDPEGWEFKTSAEPLDKSKKWHDWQGRFYCTMFDRPVWAILQPVIKDSKLMLREIGRVERDDEWVYERLEELLEFHEEVLAELRKVKLADVEKLIKIEPPMSISTLELDVLLTKVLPEIASESEQRPAETQGSAS